MFDEKAWITVSALIHPGLCAVYSNSSTPNRAHCSSVFMNLDLYMGGRKKRVIPKLFSAKLAIMTWYAKALRIYFARTKVPHPAPKKYLYTIISPPPNFTVGTMHLDKYHSPGNRQAQTGPSDCQNTSILLH